MLDEAEMEVIVGREVEAKFKWWFGGENLL
jgi:hypothetical protein